ncbi:MAG: LysR family transcriptional regulator [Oscillospiraceae bacterium]|nr:LysR family transcriptional regulator [Oscillospiraceae bacterium]
MIMLNNNLRIFITAAELQSLTETAKKLYVSQPAISHAIKKLEEELGVRLFIRNKRSTLTLTEAGKDILALAYQMADLENRLYQRAYAENHLMGGVIRVATVPLGASLVLARVLPIFKKQFPGVQVELLEGTPLEVKNMVLNYQVDLGISTSPYMGLEHKLLMMDRMISIHRDDGVNIDLKKENASLVLCRVAYDSIKEQLAGQNIDLSHSIVMEAASTQINMVEEGNGTGVISELMLSTIPNALVRGPVLPKMEIEISLITHNFDDLSTAAKEMASMILERSL